MESDYDQENQTIINGIGLLSMESDYYRLNQTIIGGIRLIFLIRFICVITSQCKKC